MRICEVFLYFTYSFVVLQPSDEGCYHARQLPVRSKRVFSIGVPHKLDHMSFPRLHAQSLNSSPASHLGVSLLVDTTVSGSSLAWMYRSDSILFLVRLGRSLSEVAVWDLCFPGVVVHHDNKQSHVWVGAISNITLVVLADFATSLR